jgi:transposase
VTLVAATLDSRFLADLPERLIGDRAYDADPLDAALAELGIEMIAPHRRNRKRPKTQDGRPLRRYKRRWKVERLFAWLGNFRRLIVRYERHALNYLGLVHLGCILILLRQGAQLAARAHHAGRSEASSGNPWSTSQVAR